MIVFSHSSSCFSLTQHDTPSHPLFLQISFLEIYNEKLDDLLSPEPSSFQQDAMDRGNGLISSPAFSPGPRFAVTERLKIVADEKHGVRVAGLEEVTIQSPKDAFEYLKRGFSKRATVGTRCNAQSSRSHCVFTMVITMKEFMEGQDIVRVGKLNLVDLAGSENVGRSGATDRRAREAGNINQSLLTLGRVINSLNDGVSWVPYRDSKLTRLLQDSLGGKSKTCMIATLSPSTENLEETLSTLDYAARAKKIKNKPEQFMRLEKRDMISQAYKELERLRERFRAQIEAQDGMVFVKEEEYEALQARAESLESEMEALSEAHGKTRLELEATQEELANTQQALEDMTLHAQKVEADLRQRTHELELKIAELEAEKIRHEETRAVSRAKSHTEGLLTDQVQELFATLQASVRDVVGLNDKVHRSKVQIQEHVAHAGAFKSSSSEQLDDLSRVSNEFHATQSSLCSLLSERLLAMVETNKIDSSSVFESLNQVQTRVRNFANTSATELRNFGDSAENEITKGKDLSNADYQTISDLLSNFNDELAARINSTTNVLAEKEAFWNTWVFELQNVFQAMASNTESYRKQHMASLQSLSELIHLETSKLEQSLHLQKESVSKFEKKSIEQMSEMKDSFLKSMTKALESFVTSQNSLIQNEANTLTAAIQRSSAANASLQTTSTTQLANVSEKYSAWAQEAKATAEKSEAQVKAKDTVYQGHINDATKAVQATRKTGETFSDSLAQQSRIGKENTINTLETLTTTVSAYASSRKAQIQTFRDESEKQLRQVDDQVKAAQDNVQSSVQTQQLPLVESTRENTSSFHETLNVFSVTLSDSVKKLVDRDIKSEQTTGLSPKVSSYPVPDAIQNTAPEDTVLDNFRRAITAGLAEQEVEYHTYGFRTNTPFRSEILSAIQTLPPLEVDRAEGVHVLPEQPEQPEQEQVEGALDGVFEGDDAVLEGTGPISQSMASTQSLSGAGDSPETLPAGAASVESQSTNPFDDDALDVVSEPQSSEITSGSVPPPPLSPSFVTPRKEGVVPEAVHRIESKLAAGTTPR